jgi:hypothetical protein
MIPSEVCLNGGALPLRDGQTGMFPLCSSGVAEEEGKGMPAAFRKPEFTVEDRAGTVIRLIFSPQPGGISGAAKEHGVSRQYMSKLVSETRGAVVQALEPKAPGRPRKTIPLLEGLEGDDLLRRIIIALWVNGVS